MKKRTKEENAAYAREQRAKKKGVSPVSPRITPKIVSPVSPCAECEKLKLEIKKLTARLAVKEAKESGANIKESAEDLFARNIAAKNERFQKIGMMAH